MRQPNCVIGWIPRYSAEPSFSVCLRRDLETEPALEWMASRTARCGRHSGPITDLRGQSRNEGCAALHRPAGLGTGLPLHGPHRHHHLPAQAAPGHQPSRVSPADGGTFPPPELSAPIPVPFNPTWAAVDPTGLFLRGLRTKRISARRHTPERVNVARRVSGATRGHDRPGRTFPHDSGGERGDRGEMATSRGSVSGRPGKCPAPHAPLQAAPAAFPSASSSGRPRAPEPAAPHQRRDQRSPASGLKVIVLLHGAARVTGPIPTAATQLPPPSGRCSPPAPGHAGRTPRQRSSPPRLQASSSADRPKPEPQHAASGLPVPAAVSRPPGFPGTRLGSTDVPADRTGRSLRTALESRGPAASRAHGRPGSANEPASSLQTRTRPAPRRRPTDTAPSLKSGDRAQPKRGTCARAGDKAT